MTKKAELETQIKVLSAAGSNFSEFHATIQKKESAFQHKRGRKILPAPSYFDIYS
jgi:hypothetical protein